MEHRPADHDQLLMLPDDVLADVLRRLPPRWLAASRCVCKALRAFVDGRRLLRADLLPLTLGGVFINFHEMPLGIFSRPYMASAAPYLAVENFRVDDHCNGLLLLFDRVVNPVTGQSARLPQLPPPGLTDYGKARYLVFDPTVSPHYEVFSVPYSPGHANKQSEWPPTPCTMSVFSSTTNRWEERTFHRQGPPIGTVADMPCDWHMVQRQAVSWHGALYVQLICNYVMRISLSDDTYQVIKPPTIVRPDRDNDPDLTQVQGLEVNFGRSEKEVYLAREACGNIRVWILNESHGRMKWVLKHQKGLAPILYQHIGGPWSYHNFYYEDVSEDEQDQDHDKVDKYTSIGVKEDLFGWDSDNDDFVETKEGCHKCFGSCLGILGFHPYKEIVFLEAKKNRVMALHLNSSMVEDLGCISPKMCEDRIPECWISQSFPYTPYWGEFYENSSTFKADGLEE